MKIGLTRVYVHDPSAAFTFYTEGLGFVEKLRVPEAGLAIVVSAEEPEGTALLLEANANPIARTYQEAIYQAALPEIVFVVKDIHREHERLRERGVVFRKDPTKTQWGVEAIFEDTCGNLIQLHQV